MRVAFPSLSYRSLILLAPLTILLLPLPYDNFKFVLLTAWIGISIAAFDNISFKFTSIDLYWSIFVFLSFISYLWSINGSLVWQPSFIWLLFFVFVVVYRSLWSNNLVMQRYIAWVAIFIFFLLLVLHLIAIHLDLTFSTEWNQLLSRNSNYSSTYLVALYPFVLFAEFKGRFFGFVKLLSIVLLINLIYLTEARGALIALVLIIIYYLWVTYNQRNMRFYIPVIGLGILFLAILFINQRNETSSIPMIERYKDEYPSRIYLVNKSLEIFKSRPVVGVGAGNECNYLYTEDVAAINGLNDQDRIVRIRSHNLYARVLTEYGLLGFLLFFLPIAYVFFKSISTSLRIYQASFASLMVYLVAIIFYATSNSLENLFSSIHLLAFMALAILSNKYSPVLVNKYPKLLISSVLLLCLIWFVYSWVCFTHTVDLRKSTNIRDENQLDAVERLYSNTFFTAYSYDQSVAHKLANYYSTNGELDKANDYYIVSNKLFPDNIDVIMDFASFLNEKRDDKDGAVRLIDKVLKMQSNYKPAIDLKNRLIK